MKKKNKSEWLSWYAQRGGSQNLELEPDEQVLFHPEHGFSTFVLLGDTLRVKNICGDGRYWIKVLLRLMNEEGLKGISFFTARNPKIWERLCGAKIAGYEMEVSADVFRDKDEQDAGSKERP